jgi:hypothetical protein
MIELLFVACVSATTSACEEKSMIFVDVPIHACMLGAQGELAGWTRSNPGWTIRRWTCRDAGWGEQGA